MVTRLNLVCTENVIGSIVNVYSRRGNRGAMGVVKGLNGLKKPRLLVYERRKRKV